MILPNRRVLFALAVVALLLLAAAAEPTLRLAALAADALILGLCWIEGWSLKKAPVTVTRAWPERLQINRATDMAFEIENRSSFGLDVTLRQVWPDSFEAEEDKLTVRVGPNERVCVGIGVTPHRRGRIEFAPLEVTIARPLGWSVRRDSLDDQRRVSVYPDLQSLREYDMLRTSRALNQLGFHRQRVIGAGREFEQLRDYLPDDDFRNINWKATARHMRPVTNLFQVEQSRDVMLCLDASRMMGSPVGEGTALDCAVDAAIMLTHICQRQGDRVGLALFRESVDLMLKPRGGRIGATAILEHLVDAEHEPVFPSYASLVQALRLRQNHRSLLFLFTDLNDPQLATDLADVMPLLSRRHMVVVVSLRDPVLNRVAESSASDSKALYHTLAARELADERDAICQQLRQAGVHVLEADADRLSVQVINTYLSIKQRQLL